MSSEEDEHRRLEELLMVTKTTKEVSNKLMKKGHNLVEAGQSARELATAIENLAKISPDGFFKQPLFASLAGGLKEFNTVAETEFGTVAHDKRLILLAQANVSSVAISTSAAALDYPSLRGPADAQPPEFKAFSDLLHRAADTSVVKQQTEYFGLDARRGEIRSPLQLLEAAEGALKRPFSDEGYAIAVLVPLREAIQQAVDELLKKRPSLGRTGGLAKKISAIGQHFGNAAISSDHIERIATSAHTLINRLSGAKDHEMGREQIADLFDQGISLLQSIFAMIDPRKLP